MSATRLETGNHEMGPVNSPPTMRAALIPKFASIRIATRARIKKASGVLASEKGGITILRIAAMLTAIRAKSETRSITRRSGKWMPSGSLDRLMPGKTPCSRNSVLAITRMMKDQKMTK